MGKSLVLGFFDGVHKAHKAVINSAFEYSDDVTLVTFKDSPAFYFGKNVKIERIKKDLTQEQLAEIMGKSQNYVACIECGMENMSLGKILELSKCLKTDIENLLKFR